MKSKNMVSILNYYNEGNETILIQHEFWVKCFSVELHSRLGTCKYWTVEELANSLERVYQGVKSLHDQNLIHGNVTENAIIINQEGEIQLIDSVLSEEGGLSDQRIFKQSLNSKENDLWQLGYVFLKAAVLQEFSYQDILNNQQFLTEKLHIVKERYGQNLYQKLGSLFSQKKNHCNEANTQQWSDSMFEHFQRIDTDEEHIYMDSQEYISAQHSASEEQKSQTDNIGQHFDERGNHSNDTINLQYLKLKLKQKLDSTQALEKFIRECEININHIIQQPNSTNLHQKINFPQQAVIKEQKFEPIQIQMASQTQNDSQSKINKANHKNKYGTCTNNKNKSGNTQQTITKSSENKFDAFFYSDTEVEQSSRNYIYTQYDTINNKKEYDMGKQHNCQESQQHQQNVQQFLQTQVQKELILIKEQIFALQQQMNILINTNVKQFEGPEITDLAAMQTEVKHINRNAQILYQNGIYYIGEVDESNGRSGFGTLHSSNKQIICKGYWFDDNFIGDSREQILQNIQYAI